MDVNIDANTIYHMLEDNFTNLECANTYHDKYIKPSVKENFESGRIMESDFYTVICDHQQRGFISGFNAAIKFILSCTAGGAS